MLNINKLSKKYGTNLKTTKRNLDIAYREAGSMGKQNDDFYVEEIFSTLIMESSNKLSKYKSLFNEVIISSSIPQNLRPEQHNVSKKDREESEKLKNILKIKNSTSFVK